MPYYKCDWTFNLATRGWLETWYLFASNINAALTNFSGCANDRIALTGAPTRIVMTRVSDVDFLNDSRVSPTRYVSQHGQLADNSDQANAAIYARIQAGNLYSRVMHLRGQPDDWIKFTAPDGSWAPPGYLVNLWKSWTDRMIAAQLRLKAWNRDTGASPIRTVTNITTAPSGKYLITSPAHGFTDLDRVRVWGARGTNVKQTTGDWEVFSVTANTFEIPLVVIGAPVYLGFGRCRKRVPVYPVVTEGNLAMPSVRRTGNPPGNPRGRRKRRAI